MKQNTSVLPSRPISVQRWSKHTNAIQANKTLGFVRRNLKIGAISMKERAFKTFVRPQLEYACQVWDPYRVNTTKTLENVLRKVARWVINRSRQTSSVGDMLRQLNWKPQEERRKKIRLTTLHGYHHGEVAINSAHKPTFQIPKINTRSSHDHKYATKNTYRDYRKYSFFPCTAPEFNKLSHDALTASVESPAMLSY